MDITAIEKELNTLLILTSRWSEQGYIPTIERDIALSRIRTIYDTVLTADDKEPQQTAPDVVAVEVAAVEVVAAVDEEVVEEEVAVEEEVVEEEVVEEEEAVENEVVENEFDEEPTIQHKIAENFQNEQQTRFIHDLFCNDETFYNQEISKINQLESLDDVLIYIGQKYAWSPDNVSAQQFVELQSRRFGV